LHASLEKWKSIGMRGVWLKIPSSQSQLIKIAIDSGFVYHHAQREYLMLTHWLVQEKCTLPEYAGHYVGVGGFVVNDKREVLVVQEKSGPVRSIWKIPGGSVDPKEDLHIAAIREVYEETRVKTEVISMLGFRQHHTASFGKSDLYFVFRLKPLTTEVVKQESEIAAVKWIPLDELLSLPYYKGLYKSLLELGRHSVDNNYAGFTGQELPIVFRKGTNILYHGVPKL